MKDRSYIDLVSDYATVNAGGRYITLLCPNVIVIDENLLGEVIKGFLGLAPQC